MKILVPSDGSEHAGSVIKHALQFAAHIGAEDVRVIYVVDTTPLEELTRINATVYEKKDGDRILNAEEIYSAIDERAKKSLDHIKEEVNAISDKLGKLKIEFGIRKGEPSTEILKEAESFGADMIIMGSRRLGSRFALGSTADKVIRGAKIPVMVAGPNSEFNEIKCILVPLDMSEYSEAAIGFAVELAKKLNSRIKLFHVVHESAVRYFSSISWFGEKEKQKLISEYRKAAEAYLKEKANSISGVTVDIDVVAGEPVDEILQQADRDECQLIVMSTRGMGHVGRFLIGSVTGGVVNQAKIPVVVVKESSE